MKSRRLISITSSTTDVRVRAEAPYYHARHWAGVSSRTEAVAQPSALPSFLREPLVQILGLVYRYNKRVFLTPPWPEIYETDQERRHGLGEAIAEYDRLIGIYLSLGYDIHVLPKVGVAERADWILASLVR